MPGSVTVLLKRHRDGQPEAMDELADLLYPELKAMARRRAGSRPGGSATTLVQETFLKLLAGGDLVAEDRQQFFGLVATVMRQIIVDEVRYITAAKRKRQDVTLTEAILGDDSHEKAAFLLEVNDLLGKLALEDERLVRVFECRYFAGFTMAETAEALGTSERTAERLWSSARSRLAALMAPEAS